MDEVPWIEKYRPLELSDIVGNDEAIDRLRVISQDGNLPHLILSGPPGCGKTSALLCLARTLLHDRFKDAVLELNASDERGIKVVRNRIKSFCAQKLALPPGRHKIVLLDEADSMTKEAQQALRRMMEVFSPTTRFALACNMSSKIIEPIQSRCAIVRFTRLSDSQMEKRIVHVIQVEKVGVDEEGMRAVLCVSDGDLRAAFNTLQAAVAAMPHVTITADMVYRVADRPHPRMIESIISSLVGVKTDFPGALGGMMGILQLGYAPVDIITTFSRTIRNSSDLSDELKLEFLKEVGLTHMRLVDGVASTLQLVGLVSRLYECQQHFVSTKGPVVAHS